MKRAALLLVLLLGTVAFGDDAKSSFTFFGKGSGRDWRGPVTGLDKPSVKTEAEGGPGTLEFSASKDADHYIVYFFEKAPTVAKGQEEAFWKGSAEGFIGGLEVTPRKEATTFTIVDSNKVRPWSVAYVYVIEAKERKVTTATWKTDVKKDVGPDGFTLPNRYRAAPAPGR